MAARQISVLLPTDSDLSAIASLSTTSWGRALLTLADASAGRTALGLGTAATQSSGAFEVAGAAATAQAAAIAASQPVDSDLTAIAALTTTSFGRDFLALADHAALVTKLALVSADIPNLDASKITTGTLAQARGGAPIVVRSSPQSAITVAQSVVTQVFTLAMPALVAGDFIEYDFYGYFYTSTNASNVYPKVSIGGSTYQVDGTTASPNIWVSLTAGATSNVHIRGWIYVTSTTSQSIAMEGVMYNNTLRGIQGTSTVNVSTSQNLVMAIVSSSTGGTINFTPTHSILKVYR